MIEVTMPKFGLTMEQGTIVRWLRREEERVEKGDTLFLVESDKAVLEAESPSSGYLRRILVPKGGTVPVLTVVALMTETADEEVGGYEVKEPTPMTALAGERTSQNARAVAASPVAPSDRALASPRARRQARQAGIDLSLVQGSGPGGRIVETDVLAHIESRPEATPAAQDLATPSPHLPPAPYEVVPMEGLRSIVAERMAESARSTAPVTLTTEADATALVGVRERLKEALGEQLGISLGYNDLLIKMAALALRELPAMNTQLVGDEIHRLDQVNVGLAVETERGLLVVTVSEADEKALAGIASEVRVLVERARADRSLPDDLSGGTFTITNLGMFDVDAFTPIINLPECAILGVGRIKEKPVVVGGEICVRGMVWLSLTFDHRLVDGAYAARFLRRIKEFVEQPYLLLA